jgi:hypothetical protein
MVKTGIIIGFSAFVGWLLTNALMLIIFLVRMPRYEFMFREIVSVFFSGGIGKNYIDLLRESHMEPSRLDKALYFLGRVFACSLVGGIVLAIFGLI